MTVIEQQSTYSGAGDLLDKMKTFLTANGWVSNEHIAGDELYISKGSIFASMKVAAAAVNPWTTTSVGYTDVAVNPTIYLSGSDSYDILETWDEQPGFPVNNEVKEVGVAMPDLNTGSSNYWFFLGTSPDAFYCVAQVGADAYRFLAFGELDKAGTYTGGQFITASRCRFDVANSTDYLPPFASADRTTEQQNCLVRVNHASFNGWVGNGYSPSTVSPNMCTGQGLVTTLQLITNAFDEDNYVSFQSLPNYAPKKDSTAPSVNYHSLSQRAFNTGNQLSILLPVMGFMSRSDISGGYSPLGKLPHCFYANMTNLNTDTIYVYGAANYRIMATFSVQNAGDTGVLVSHGLAFPVT